MGRRVINDVVQEIEAIEKSGLSPESYQSLKSDISTYYEVNNQVKSLKKSMDVLNKNIKEQLMQENLDHVEVGGYSAKITTVSSVSFDPDILLALVKEIGREDLIKTREYVDVDDIERLVYTGKLNAKDVAPAQILKEQVRLNVGKVK